MTHNDFNPFTGRLKKSTRFQPLYPLKPSVLNTSEQKLIWDSMTTKSAEVKAPDTGRSSSNLKIYKTYEFFQKNIHAPVYKMAGTKDMLLFGITLTIMAGCAVNTGKLLYNFFKKY
ncbi:hypothetical protein HZH66_010256 [Vespula vulgaris]|uniref:Uncharacterized protein n=1 Tax=Vespula vulgaris TaxID=7454 RepID=A0A834MZ61_VESVU|nr:uncharacterized protein LOC127067841 [Vespula vulgaris]KAF7389119.1 hypothetical protein HZH66_010256 [Vespula vulgaris]